MIKETIHDRREEKKDNRILNLLNVLVLFSALLVIVDLSYNVLEDGIYDPDTGRSYSIQFWVCIVFMIDFWVKLRLSPRKGRFIARNFVMLLLSIPYLNISSLVGVTLHDQMHYGLTLMPIVRAGYGLVVIIRWFTRRSTTNLVFTYMSVVASFLYLGSMLFFIVEKAPVNENVHSYWDALWWACMDLTTVGSNITPVTMVGKVLSVIIALSGMMMLPIFTVFISEVIKKAHASRKPKKPVE
ncbi:MAG: potassium channel family protein [Rikenellaceae bacterium]